MGIAISITPGHIFEALWKPKGTMRESYTAELIARLTSGWDDWQIVRELHDSEIAQLESLLAIGRVWPVPPGWE